MQGRDIQILKMDLKLCRRVKVSWKALHVPNYRETEELVFTMSELQLTSENHDVTAGWRGMRRAPAARSISSIARNIRSFV
jgi:hypothetical protein